MFVLEDIWYGNVTPSDRRIREGSHYQKTSHQAAEYLQTFRNELSPEGKKVFDDYYRTQMELGEISEKDAYFRGIRLGVQIVLDVIGNYRSDLPLVAEDE